MQVYLLTQKSIIMKKVLLFSAFSAISFLGFSQDKSASKDISFNGGLEIGLPMGTFGDSHGFGIGVSAQMNYPLADKMALTVNAGYISYSGKSVSVTVPGIVTTSIKTPNLGVIPVLAGLNYSFTDKVYGSAQLGMSFLSSTGSSSSGFTFAPGVGYKINKLDFLVKYTSISATGGSLGSVGLRAAYNF